MPKGKDWYRVAIVTAMIGSILFLHYFTLHELKYHHALYRTLFYLPLILGTFWFGLKGALYVVVSVFIFYLPYMILRWQGFSVEDFDRTLEGALFIIIALLLGFLVERERKRHRKLLQARSLAAVGRAVSEIAHDMKTPLMAIGGFAGQVSRDLSQDDRNQNKLDIVRREAARLESMVRAMLDFGKPLELRLVQTDVNRLVIETVEVAQPMARETNVELKVDLNPSLPVLSLDGPRIKQVLLNLTTNAIQASAEGERVLISSRSNGDCVELKIVDTGSGIEEEFHGSVFHPFFSTKKGGTGLGLGIVKKIVDAHAGRISFHSNPEKGVTFTLWFPYQFKKERTITSVASSEPI